MVLLGVGVLVLSIVFLTYKFPPATWRSSSASAQRQTANAAAKEGQEEERKHTQKDESARADASPRAVAIDTSKPSEDDIDSPSTTPKARPQNGAPIPQFALDDSNTNGATTFQAVASPAKPQTLSAPFQPTPPSLPKPNLMPPPPKPPAPSSSPASTLMPPPSIRPSSLRPLPRLAPPTSNSSANTLNPPPSAASSLRGPPRGPPRGSSSSTLKPVIEASTSTLPPSQRASRKVLLPPGHSPLDWAQLTRNPPTSTTLRGADVPPGLIKVTPAMLRLRNGRKGRDAWGTWQGKVYNMTPYRDFHPGGVGELMRGAGKVGEAERLFREIHPWVNWEGMLGECLVGIMVTEAELAGESGMDEMD